MIIDISPQSDFSIHNIPFGIFSTENTKPRVGVAMWRIYFRFSSSGKI